MDQVKSILSSRHSKKQVLQPHKSHSSSDHKPTRRCGIYHPFQIQPFHFPWLIFSDLFFHSIQLLCIYLWLPSVQSSSVNLDSTMLTILSFLLVLVSSETFQVHIPSLLPCRTYSSSKCWVYMPPCITIPLTALILNMTVRHRNALQTPCSLYQQPFYCLAETQRGHMQWVQTYIDCLNDVCMVFTPSNEMGSCTHTWHK